MRKRGPPPAPQVIDDDTAARMAAALCIAPLTSTQRERMRAKILQRVQEEAPAGTFTVRAADMQWLAAGPGVEIKVLRRDLERNDQTVLIRMQPGSVVVAHRHTQEEECLILEGEVFIGTYRLNAGDMHVARAGVIHAPIRAPHGALLMIRSEIPPTAFRIA